MAKKKKAIKKKTTRKKPAKTTKRKAARKKATPTKKVKAAKRSTGRGAAKATAKTRKATKASLGRPKVTGEEKLYLLFKEEYHARQIFAFLQVETVKELEQFSPDEIVKLLSKPIRQTVNQIRRRLAEKNRCLAGDEQHALKLSSK